MQNTLCEKNDTQGRKQVKREKKKVQAKNDACLSSSCPDKCPDKPHGNWQIGYGCICGAAMCQQETFTKWKGH